MSNRLIIVDDCHAHSTDFYECVYNVDLPLNVNVNNMINDWLPSPPYKVRIETFKDIDFAIKSIVYVLSLYEYDISKVWSFIHGEQSIDHPMMDQLVCFVNDNAEQHLLSVDEKGTLICNTTTVY